jgi:2-polyprenyl-3-methyl-5-hydroxy-6-metoxy-1,4-benzoquinol methylase
MDPKELVRAGYDAVSARYQDDDAPDGPRGEWLATLSTRLPASAEILDLGCGCGVPADRWVVERGCRVTGVDVSPVQIERAERLVPQGRFVRAGT